MATYKRLPRGKKKRENELLTFAEKAYAWVLGNWRTVALTAAAIIIAFGAIIGGYTYQSWRAEAAADALAEAQRMTDEAGRRTALEDVAQDYRRTAAGREARAWLAAGDEAKGALSDAVAQLEELYSSSRRYPIVRVYALQRLGAIYGALGEWEKAVDAFECAATTKGNLIKERSEFDQARSLEQLGKSAEARAIYTKLSDESSEADLLTKAESEERLLWLMAHQRKSE